MSLLSRRLATLTLGVLSVIAVVSIPSLATQVVRHPSRVTISEKAPAFHGRVKSNAHPCVQQRKVKPSERRAMGRTSSSAGTTRTTTAGGRST